MAYNKKTWGSDEVITKEALNNIENGIEAVEQSIPKLVSQLVNDAGYITEHLDLSNYAEKDDLHEHNNKEVLDGISLVRMQAWDNAALNGGNGEESVDLSNYATKQDLNLKADKSELFSKDYNELLNKPTIPDLNGYATQSYVNNEIQNKVNSLESQINALLERIVALENQSGNDPEDPEDPEEPTIIPCTSISLNKSSLTFTNANSQTLVATKLPSNTTDTISWKSSKISVATVFNGIVTPKTDGECIITVTCGNYSASCNVLVNIEESVNTYSITNDLTNVSTNNSATSIEEGQAYNAILTCGNDYNISSVVVTMNGIDITNDIYEPEYSEDPEGSTYSITNNLTNVSTNNSITSIEEGQSYNATLTCGDDYDMSSVVVTMNGINVTNSVYEPEDPTT